jgi:hypothetical protein
MNNKGNQNETLARMKALMGYGLQTENKQAYSSVEYQKVGADGNVYGIVREGTKYYIKSAPNKKNLIKEDFTYIGGFRNRKDNEYNSYANAQKQFDLKMMSLKEAANKTDFKVSSWNLEGKENVVAESSEKMQKEILRERQIMKNAMAINEKKAVCCDAPSAPKDNIGKTEKPQTGNAENAVDHEKAELPKEMTEGKTCPKCGKNPCQCESVNEEEVLGWNRGNDEYMDKSHGTEIGDSAPFDDATARNIDDGDKKVSKTGEMKNGVVENHGTSMHDADNQNSPSVGVGEGPSDDNNKPFDDKKGKQIDEAIDDFGAEGEEELGDDDLDGDPMGDDLGTEGGEDDLGGEPMGDDLGAEGDEELGDDDLGDEDDVYEDDTESRLDAMEDLLTQIASKLGVEEGPVDDEAYEDEDIFGDEGEDDFGGEDEFGGEDDFGAEDDEMPMESRRRRGGVQIYETKAFRNAMRRQRINEARRRRINEDGMTPFKDAGRVPSGNMNKLDDFGKHPAYQKKVMELPPKDLQEFPGYYDMNDDSVRNDNPYGEKIGDGAPFEIDPQSIDNAIAEAFNRLKKNRK